MIYAGMMIQLSAGSYWKCKDGTGSTVVRDSGSFKLDAVIDPSGRCSWAREDDRGFFLTFKNGGYASVPHDKKLSLVNGFVLEVFFSCDLEAIGSTGFACIASKGENYDDGYSLMVRKNGSLLININGLTRSFYGIIRKPIIKSKVDHRVRVEYDRKEVKVFCNGKRVACYPVAGTMVDKGGPFRIGSCRRYPLTGNIYEMKVGPYSAGKDKGGKLKGEATELERLQQFKPAPVIDPPGTVIVSSLEHFGPEKLTGYGKSGAPGKYIQRENVRFWNNDITTMIYPAPVADVPDLICRSGLKGKYDVYLAVRSLGVDTLTQVRIGSQYYRIFSHNLGKLHRSYEVLLERDVDISSTEIALAPGLYSYVGYFKFIPSANRRRNEIPDPAGVVTKGPRMTIQDFEDFSRREIEKKFADGLFRRREWVESRKAAKPSARSVSRGYQLFEQNYLEHLFKNSVPTVEKGDISLRAAAAPGEFEPVAFGIHALRPLKNVSLKCGDFTAADGRKAAVGCHIGVVELLDKRQTNYTNNTEVMYGPLYVENDNRIRGGVNQGESRQYWLTLRAPADTPAGIYRSELMLDADGRKSRIPLVFEIYPFKLDQHDVGLMLFATPVHDKGEAGEAVLRDLADHGIRTVMLNDYNRPFAFKGDTAETLTVDWENSVITRVMTLCKKLQMDRSVLIKIPVFRNQAKLVAGSKAEVDAVVERLIRELAAKAEAENWPEMHLMTHDEVLSNSEVMDEAMSDLRIIRRVGLINSNNHIWYKTSRSYQKFCDEFAAMNNVFVNRFNTRNMWYVDTWREMQTRCEAEGKFMGAYNSNNAVVFSQPAAARYSFGWFHRTAGKGAICHGIYAYQESYGNPYNDLDGNFTDWIFHYPALAGRKGGPSLDWECYREGSDDLRYITTLENRIAAAEKSGIDVAAEKKVLRELVNSFDMEKFYAESLFITPKWEKMWSSNGRHYASGKYNVPNGWEYADYDNARRKLAKAIISIDNKIRRK